MSSYSPLLVLISMRLVSVSKPLALTFAAIAAASIAVLVLFFYAHRRRARTAATFRAVQQRDGDIMGYVITYLIPFVGATYLRSDGTLDTLNLLSVCLLFGVIITIYVNANLIYVNPVLALARYRIYEIETIGGQKKALLTRRTIVPTGESIDIISIGPYVLWEPNK